MGFAEEPEDSEITLVPNKPKFDHRTSAHNRLKGHILRVTPKFSHPNQRTRRNPPKPNIQPDLDHQPSTFTHRHHRSNTRHYRLTRSRSPASICEYLRPLATAKPLA